MKKDRQNIQGITFHEIELGEHDEFSEVQLMRTGSFTHMFFGEIEITEDMFKSFRKNFKKKVKKVELAVDYSHFSGERASGWITDVILKEKNTELWIRVEWTPAGRQGILDKEFKYLSSDFSENFQDNETGKKFGPTLNGAALTNRPFLKDMEAILSDIDMSDEKRQAIVEIYNNEPETEGNKPMKFAELKETVAKLSDEEKAELGIETQETKLSDTEAQVANVKITQENKELSEENKKLKEDAEKTAKETQFAKMLTDGTAVEAQRNAFLSDNMVEFVKFTVPTNMKGKGTGEGEDTDTSSKDKKFDTSETASAEVLRLCKEKMKDDKDLTDSLAQNMVFEENPDLYKVIYGDIE